MEGLIRLWTMTALEAARRSEQSQVRPTQVQPSLPATLGKAGAWSRWMARRDEGAAEMPTGPSQPDGATA
jgi:hypothetical protein